MQTRSDPVAADAADEFACEECYDAQAMEGYTMCLDCAEAMGDDEVPLRLSPDDEEFL